MLTKDRGVLNLLGREWARLHEARRMVERPTNCQLRCLPLRREVGFDQRAKSPSLFGRQQDDGV
jgi:hypothetical protein